MRLEEMVLPVSGLHVQWRSTDEHFRIHPTIPADSTIAVASEQLPWRPWLGRNDMAVGASGPISGAPAATWCAVWGAYTGSDVLVTRDDLSHPDVMIFGKLWITEWLGPEQEATVVAAGRLAEIQFAPTILSPPTAGTANWSHVETPAAFHEIPTLQP